MKNNVLNFTVVIYQDEDGLFVAEAPAIPGCHTQGETYEEVLRNIAEAIRLCLKVAAHDPVYREHIDMSGKTTSKFVGISEVSFPRPSFL